MSSRWECDFGRTIGPHCQTRFTKNSLAGDTRNCALFLACTTENYYCAVSVTMGDYSIDCNLPVNHSGRHYDSVYKLVWESFNREED